MNAAPSPNPGMGKGKRATLFCAQLANAFGLQAAPHVELDEACSQQQEQHAEPKEDEKHEHAHVHEDEGQFSRSHKCTVLGAAKFGYSQYAVGAMATETRIFDAVRRTAR
eukprot:3537952-Prymnesium_polylepis.1